MAETRSLDQFAARPGDGKIALQALTAVASILLVTVSVYYPAFAGLLVGGAVFAVAAVWPETVLAIVIFISSFAFYLKTDLPVRDVDSLARVAAFLGAAVGARFRFRSGWLTAHRLNFWILAYAAVALASVILFNTAETDSKRFLMRLASCICLYFAVIMWVRTEPQFKTLLTLLLTCALLMEVYAFYQAVIQDFGGLYFFFHPPDENTLPWVGRTPSLISHFNSFAGYVNLVLPFAIGCFAFHIGPKFKKFGLLVAGFGICALVLTQSRGGLIAGAFTLVLAIWLLIPRLKTRVALLAVLGVCIAAAVVMMEYFLPRVVELDDTTLSRLAIYGAAWLLFVQSPLVGIGYGNFRHYQPSVLGIDMSFVDAHNLYLQLLSETGVIGCVLFVGIVIITLRLAYRQLRRPLTPFDAVWGFGALAAMCSVLIHGFVDMLFFQSPEFHAMFWIVVALTVANELRRRAGNPSFAASGVEA